VRGLGSRYERLAADAPELALGNNAKPRLLRLDSHDQVEVK